MVRRHRDKKFAARLDREWRKIGKVRYSLMYSLPWGGPVVRFWHRP